MLDDKVQCMIEARKFGQAFWDGDRRTGYGGYVYDGRWAPVAERLVTTYGLKDDSCILDAGCGKGFLLYELKKLLPACRIAGFDISEYAIGQAPEPVRQHLKARTIQQPWPYRNGEFDLVVSLNTLHNLQIFDLEHALEEMERVAKNKYLVVESYRNESELFNLQCWALTCECFFTPGEWKWLFSKFGYTGDHEFIYFE
jgi:SAM-dependent methyltransferase